MNIQRTLINNILSVKEPIQTLKVGQILSGQVQKLYPNNKAQIQLGNLSLVAQLEASLSIGSKYFFQVMAKGNVIQLKVIGDAKERKRDTSINNVLKYLGVKGTKVNEEFIQQLIRKEIAINPHELKEATAILSSSTSKDLSKAILLEMIKNNLPITDQVYSALEKVWTSSFSEQITSLNSELVGNHSISESIKQITAKLLNNLIGATNNIPTNIVQHISENVDLFNVAKGFGFIQQDVPYEEWRSMVNQIEHNETHINQVFRVDRQTFFQTLSRYEELNDKAKDFLLKWNGIRHANHNLYNSMTEETFQEFREELEQFYRQHLNENVKVVNDSASIMKLLERIEWMAKLANTPQLASLYHEYIKALFNNQATAILNDVGLQYEKAIYRDEPNLSFTLKGLLMQLLSLNESSVKGVSERLLQYVNGLQIQSMNESEKFLQANLLIPGQGFGLENDVTLSFQGQKDEQGAINPDYCRIVFLIELEHIKETVIDMHVQKRAVSLQVINDYPLVDIAKSVKPLLKAGLEKIGYQLSSITFTPHQTAHKGDRDNLPFIETDKEVFRGVDFRI